MKAVICSRYGYPNPLEVCDVPPPAAARDEVVLSVRAAGLNFRDFLAIQNKYQATPAPPFCPGCEAAGVVTAVGQDVTGVRAGDRVVAFTEWGAFAQETAAKARHVVAIPPSMDFDAAAAMLVTYGTAMHALADRGRLRRGQVLLVYGAAGAAGQAAVEVGKALGARVIAAVSSEERTAACAGLGADATINYAGEDLRQRLRQLTPAGVDVIYDPVGGILTEQGLRAMAWRGRLLVVGFASGAVPSIPINLLLVKGCSLVGVWWGEFVRRESGRFARTVSRLARLYRKGAINPRPNHVIPFDRVGDGMAMLAERRSIGKIVISLPT